MIPLALLVVSLFSSPSSADEAFPAQSQADQLAVCLRAVRLAFEKGTPPLDTVEPVLKRLSEAPDASEPDPAWAEQRQQSARRLLTVLDEVRGIQAGQAYAPKRTIQGMGPAEQRMIDGMAQQVNAISDDLGIKEPPRRAAILDLYLARWQKDRNGLTPEAIAAERQFAQTRQAQGMRRQEEAGQKVNARLRDMNALHADPGSVVAAGAPAAPRPAVSGAIESLRSSAPRRISRAGDVPAPTFAQRQTLAAQETDRILAHDGGDDGSWTYMAGRTVAQGKKFAHQMLSFFGDKETWKRTADAATELASHPVDAVTYLPGGLLEAGKTVVAGVKQDIVVARGALSDALEHPTPFTILATVGATGMAVSDVFLVKSGERATAGAALERIAKGADEAEHFAKTMRLGSELHDLDFTKPAAVATQDRLGARAAYAQVVQGGREGTLDATKVTARIGADPAVFDKVEALGRQKGMTCARYAITACALANGADATLDRTMEASKKVLKDEAAEKVRILEIQRDGVRAAGGDARALEQELAAARKDLEYNAEFFHQESGLNTGHLKATMDELGLQHKSLGFRERELQAMIRGGDAEAYVAARREMQKNIDLELNRGRAVMAAIYTGEKDTGHTFHAVTVLGKGRTADGSIIYQVYDSNAGKVVPFTPDHFNVYGAVVVN